MIQPWQIALLAISWGVAMYIDKRISKEKFTHVKFFVETLLISCLSFAIMMFVETYIFELTVTQSLDKRINITIYNFFTARLYGITRDTIIHYYITRPKWLIDGFVYVVYHGVPYIGIVFFDGEIALSQKITIGLATLSGTFIIGALYGRILEFTRILVIKST
ncbi:MAG: L-alanine exporter AlaE [Candidatus Pacebacteria bacterium]|nr:L-alanine exporter AlaE [Candidatus Paceibacterota bacterium]